MVEVCNEILFCEEWIKCTNESQPNQAVRFLKLPQLKDQTTAEHSSTKSCPWLTLPGISSTHNSTLRFSKPCSVPRAEGKRDCRCQTWSYLHQQTRGDIEEQVRDSRRCRSRVSWGSRRVGVIVCWQRRDRVPRMNQVDLFRRGKWELWWWIRMHSFLFIASLWFTCQEWKCSTAMCQQEF